MKAVTSYVSSKGIAFSTPEDALSADHDEACEEIHEVMKGATVKDYYVPHRYLIELVLAFCPIPKRVSHGIHPDSVIACQKKVDNTIAILQKYSDSLASFAKIQKGEDDDD